MAFLVNGTPIVTDGRNLSEVGIATINEDINVGRLLYDSNGNVGAGNSVLVTKDNLLQWVNPSFIGISTGDAFSPGSTYFVTENGSDTNSGDSINNSWATVKFALQNITISGDDVLIIGAGDYEEEFPLTVPEGLTVKGAGQRATTIRPTAATKNNNGFLLNNDTTVEDLTVADMKKGVTNNYAFSYEVGAAITSRGPYISRVSIINRGDVITASDPYGYNTADNPGVTEIGAGGFLADGSILDASTVSPSMLLNEVTIFPVKNVGVEMKNGTRAEVLNSFVYFAEEGIKGTSDLGAGLANAGRTRLSLVNPTTTPSVGNTIDYFSSSGTTLLATGTVDEIDGNYVYLTDSGAGEFVVPRDRVPVTVNFVGGAEISTAQAQFGPSSLDVTATNNAAVTAETSGFGFGTGDFTVEGWFYFPSFSSSRFIWDFRSTADTDSRLSLEETGGGGLAVNIGTTQVAASTGSPLSVNTWHHIAVARDGTDFHLYVDGIEEDLVTNSTDLGNSGTLHLGADYTDSSGMTGYVDDFRVTKGASKYTGATYTVPTAALTSDSNTSIMLHFDGANGDTSTEDDIITTQDIRFTGGNTAEKLSLADYSEFGADLRSIGCAVEYGDKGVVGDGQGVTLRLISINFNHVGAGGDFSNDPNLVIQANEINETNSAEISYVSIDQKGDFRVGESFFVDQENGTVSFSETTTDLTSLSSLTITDGTNSSLITPTSGRFGNVQISGNQIESTTGDLNLNTAGAGSVNINSDLNVVGVISASGVNLASIQNNDTSIALDDTGSNGTIRFITDGSEAGRFTNSNNFEVVGSIKTGVAASVTSGFYYGDGSNLTNISADNVDLTGTYQDLAGLNLSGPGVALTVTNDVSVGGSVTAANFYGDGAGLTNISADNVDLSGTDQSLNTLVVNGPGVALTVTNNVSIGGTLGATTIFAPTVSATNVSASSSVTAANFYGDGAGLTNISADNVDLTGTYQDLAGINVSGPGVALTVTNDVSVGGSVTAANFYGDGSGLTNIQADNVDLTGTYQSLAGLEITGPGIALTVTNDVSIGGSVFVTETIYAQEYDSLSDVNLKENIVTLEDALGSLSGISGVSYTWKENGKATIGVIAQEVEEVYPELVTQGEHLTVNYNGLVGVLIRAVKELNEKVEDLQRQLDEK